MMRKQKIFLLPLTLALSVLLIFSCDKGKLNEENKEIAQPKKDSIRENTANKWAGPCPYECDDPRCVNYSEPCTGGGGGGTEPLFTDPIPSSQIGSVHNQTITSIDNKFAINGINPDVLTLQQADNYTKTYMYQFFQEQHVTSITQTDISNAINGRNRMFGITASTSVVYTSSINAKGISDSLLALDNMNTFLTSNEKIIVKDLFTYLKQYSDGIIDYNTLVTKFNQLQTTWNSQNFNTAIYQGYISACALNVARNSASYWNTYDPDGGGAARMQVIPPVWVGLDAVGALAGAISVKVEGGSWSSAGRQALVWGVGSSIPGTRWFRKLFS